MSRHRRKKFGEILIAEGIISHDHLHQALAVQVQTGESVGEILLREGIITETDVVRCICAQYGLPFLRPSNYSFDTGLLDEFDLKFLYTNRTLPLDRIGSMVIVALGEVPSEFVENTLADTLGADISFYFSPAQDIELILKQHFALSQEQVLAFDEERRNRNRLQAANGLPTDGSHVEPISADPQPKPSNAQQKMIESLESSWESIFDEAENNL